MATRHPEPEPSPDKVQVSLPQLEGLRDSLNSAAANLKKEEAAVQEARDAYNQKMRWWRRAATAAVIASVLSAVTAGLAVHEAHRANDGQAKTAALLAQSKLTGCLQFNVQITHDNNQLIRIIPADTSTLSQEQLDKTRAFIVPNLRQYRDCSSDSMINRYAASNGKDGFLPLGTIASDQQNAVPVPLPFPPILGIGP